MTQPSGAEASAPEPKHARVRKEIAELVAAELSPGDALPGERQLEERFGVSRITIRRAIADLCAEGVLVRRHGKGTFVSHGRVKSSLHLASFNEDMRAEGISPTTRVVVARAEVPPAAVAEFLRLPAGQPAHHLVRVRLGNGAPVSVDECWMPVEATPSLLGDDLTGSLYGLLASYGTPVLTASQSVWADTVAGETARLLDVPAGSPALVFLRHSFTEADGAPAPIEYSVSTYRADRYQLSMTLELTTTS
ncbi:GntR family transcriptional regulator [Falsarthrobacter nasiphocae]|uniref:GntR family transcriptional regulator n=1 Tax=Falsarthrobacter nasiphocae TaxID=189863 RepID=A0AAE3YC51_9MICC|nr:GntR family transcriptional regulator [Falsarthrobacter nasiphocae]MDR6891198.1 GntR family transcriptional regulator [Falsarthrobacter nasiphocae]